MFIVSLTFSSNKSAAKDHMSGHNEWIQQGFDDGVFLAAGSIEPGLGGCVLAYNTTREELQRRVNQDPFVAEDVVKAEITEMTPKRVDERLSFLM